MVSMNTKAIAKEIRSRFRDDGISNRNVRVICRESRYGGVSHETIYVVICINNDALVSYCEPIVKHYAKLYSGRDLDFVFVRDTGSMALKV